MNTRKSIVAVAIVAAVVVIVYYRFYLKPAQPNLSTEPTQGIGEPSPSSNKEVSTVVTYAVPGGEDKTRFTLLLDKDGAIISVKSTDVIKPDEINPNLEKFNTGLEAVIKGKKLSELQNVDKIGTSSLTTDAFNKVLGELKAQI